MTRITRNRNGDPTIVDHYDVDPKGVETFAGTDYLPPPEELAAFQAQAAAEQARLDKLHKLLDASKPDPASIADVVVILKALAFGDVTKSSGDAVAAEALPVDPKGGVRGLATPDA